MMTENPLILLEFIQAILLIIKFNR